MQTTVQTILAVALALGISTQRILAQDPAPAIAAAQTSKPSVESETRTIELQGDAANLHSGMLEAADSLGVTISTTGSTMGISGSPQSIDEFAKLAYTLDRARIAAHEEDLRIDHEASRRQYGMPPFNLETGPTLGETLERVEAAFAAENFVLNVVVTDPELLKLPLANTKLRSVGFRAVVALIPKLMTDLPAQFAISVPEHASQRGNPSSPYRESQVMLIERLLSPEETPSPTVRPAYENEVYKIVAAQHPDANVVAEMKESQDNVLAAIDAGLEVMGRSPEFQIKLHRPTGTVFVKGTLDELRMVREVVHLVGPW